MTLGLRRLLARLAAWTLLFGGWLGLGALALQHGPSGWAQFAPQSLWLATAAVAQALLARHPPGMATLRGLLLAAGAATAAAIGSLHWSAAALAWGLLLVAASNVVQLLYRRAQESGATIDSPRGPAVAGALLAALLAGEPRAWVAAPVMAAALPLGLALLLTLLLPSKTSGRPSYSTAPFDCALSQGSPACRRGTAWPRLAAMAMPPMMAGLPAMAELCRAQPTPWLPGAQAAVALHLLAMLAPAWWPGWAMRAVPLLLPWQHGPHAGYGPAGHGVGLCVARLARTSGRARPQRRCPTDASPLGPAASVSRHSQPGRCFARRTLGARCGLVAAAHIDRPCRAAGVARVVARLARS